ncbi:MAG: Uma2 family endonuclease [Cyanobacteria bacterium P01_C01_bin.89]
MVQAPVRRLSLEDYLAMDHNPNCLRFEIENGIIRERAPESELNRRIAMMLLVFFSKLGIAPERLTMKTEIIVASNQVTAREPDLMILSEELAIALENAPSSIITNDLPRPDVVIEIVSPGKENRDRDYRYKRSEYATCRIPEYWIIDPEKQKVSVLQWVDGFYDVEEFTGEMAIVSSQFGTLALKPNQIIVAKT